MNIVQCKSSFCRASFPNRQSHNEGERCLTCGGLLETVGERDAWENQQVKIIGTHNKDKRILVDPQQVEA